MDEKNPLGNRSTLVEEALPKFVVHTPVSRYNVNSLADETAALNMLSGVGPAQPAYGGGGLFAAQEENGWGGARRCNRQRPPAARLAEAVFFRSLRCFFLLLDIFMVARG